RWRGYWMLLHQSLDGAGHLRAAPGPMLQSLVFQQHLRRTGKRVIVTHHFQIAAVAGALLFNDYYAIKRFLFGAKPRQANHQHRYSQSEFGNYLPGKSPKGNPPGNFILPSFFPINPPEKLFIIFLACAYCFNNWLTSCTDVPLPFAILRRRLPLMIMWLSRSRGVMESMIATT